MPSMNRFSDMPIPPRQAPLLVIHVLYFGGLLRTYYGVSCDLIESPETNEYYVEILYANGTTERVSQFFIKNFSVTPAQ